MTKRDVLKDADSEALQRYIEQTDRIKVLSSPPVHDIGSADDYRVILQKNFVTIGELARDNSAILDAHYFPLMRASMMNDTGATRKLVTFSDGMLNAYKHTLLDFPIVFLQAQQELKVADAIGDEDRIIRALDALVSASYTMINMTERLLPCNDICYRYSDIGVRAAKRLLKYLDRKKFTKLNDECKEMVLINARYIRVVSDIDDTAATPEQNAEDLRMMEDALKLKENDFYKKQIPSYDWRYHIFRTLEYICTFPDLNNRRGFSKEQLRTINAYTKQFDEMYHSDEAYFKSIHYAGEADLYVLRNAYLAGEIDLSSYKRGLEKMIRAQEKEEVGGSLPLVMLHVPLEYIMVLDRDNLSDGEKRVLNRFYSRLIRYMHRTSKKDGLIYLLGYLSFLLKYFIEVPGGIDFETMCLSLMAAVHPPTYVHSLGMADIAKCLTRHLLQRQPQLFVGMPGYGTVRSVKEHAGEIEDFVYHASLLHDVGKLHIAETILTYGRNLFENEYGYIREHPGIGAWLISRFPETAKYAEVVRGHHKWYNNKGGYPDDFDMEQSPYRTVIALVTCADCLDAATDTVGRSYKEGKSLDRYITELFSGSGTRYAPYLPELLADREVRSEIETLLAKGRDENYRKAFYLLRKHDAG